ncbi:MAG: TetR/AcrR family transcriptional regulator [Candidatus Hydrogenedentes bacterium]|nr:TetR/AcrR family transcriptional regulator [Candidatus Hydrogenedentota bacterium]
MTKAATESHVVNEAETKLLESALQLFSEKGYEGTSIREIIEGAGVTRPVLYYYFENKEDLFKRLVQSRFSSVVAQIEEVIRQTQSCRERLIGAICQSFLLSEEHPEALRLILQVFFSPPQQGPSLDKNQMMRQRFRLIEHIMRDGLENEELSGGDAQSLALVFLGIMDMHAMAKSNRPETRLTQELGVSLVDFFLAGAGYRESPKTALVSPYSS